MCGIAGLFAPQGKHSLDVHAVARSMVRRLRHRGPDGEGAWADASCGLALAHRRLAIVDLSGAGHQPMISSCGRFVIVFNGEIYNHREIRRELCEELESLDAPDWRGHSDTETLLVAIAYWGLEKTLNKSVGMFAFALWDRQKKVLHLARDRIGEKPLYYGLYKDTLLFASELKAIRAYDGFHAEVDRDVLAMFLRLNVVPAPHSIYKGIFKLPPGTFLEVTLENVLKGVLGAPKRYWSLSEAVVTGQSNLFQGGVVEACDELDRLLKQSISGQMLADVPLGAFLSGGVDSSTVVALMQEQSTTPVKTFTIGFHECGYDETQHARAVAAHLMTDHTELYVTPKDALSLIPSLPKMYDEPFSDVSQIPTFLVSELAHRSVKVCLSGDGGDELFGGYNRYTGGAKLWRQLGWLPKHVRLGLSAGMNAVSPSAWEAYFDTLGFILPRAARVRNPGLKVQKIAELLSASSSEDAYDKLVSQWSNPERVIIGCAMTSDKQLLSAAIPSTLAHEHQMMIKDTLVYLPDDILVKLDRAAMSASLETRVPMLDHRVVEFAWRLPLGMKIVGNEGKWLLRKLLHRYVPYTLTERPKAGFSVPIGTWLRGPLREWAEDLINADKLRVQGFFKPEHVHSKWIEHLQGKRDWSSQLWSILMFQAWLNEQ